MLKNSIVLLGIRIGGIQFTDGNGITLAGFIAIVVLLIIVISAYFIIQDARKTKLGENSPEKQQVAQIVAEIAKGDQVTTAFAHWSTVESQPGRTITRYWWYAIGFNKERIYVAPLSISSSKPKKVTYQNFYVIEPDQLGLVNGNKSKNGSNWVELYDKEGNKLVSLMVLDSYTETRVSEYPVDITQKEANEKFAKEIAPYWMSKVNTANGTTPTGFFNNAKALDFLGQGANVEGGGKAKNM